MIKSTRFRNKVHISHRSSISPESTFIFSETNRSVWITYESGETHERHAYCIEPTTDGKDLKIEKVN